MTKGRKKKKKNWTLPIFLNLAEHSTHSNRSTSGATAAVVAAVTMMTTAATAEKQTTKRENRYFESPDEEWRPKGDQG